MSILYEAEYVFPIWDCSLIRKEKMAAYVMNDRKPRQYFSPERSLKLYRKVSHRSNGKFLNPLKLARLQNIDNKTVNILDEIVICRQNFQWFELWPIQFKAALHLKWPKIWWWNLYRPHVYKSEKQYYIL